MLSFILKSSAGCQDSMRLDFPAAEIKKSRCRRVGIDGAQPALNFRVQPKCAEALVLYLVSANRACQSSNLRALCKRRYLITTFLCDRYSGLVKTQIFRLT
jgi:hypothetical protein